MVHTALPLFAAVVFMATADAVTSPRLTANVSQQQGNISLDILFMADIGHSREHAHTLTKPHLVMGRSAFEGAFSLYDGLFDYVVNQGVRPEAVIIAGDVGYVGGSAQGLNDTWHDFQKYLAGFVPADKVFPLIGNHDINYLGCMIPSINDWQHMCYYGQNHHGPLPAPNLSFAEWRLNWLQNFPGLQSVITPGEQASGHEWLAPLRYNLDLRPESSIYFIMGLISGAAVTTWGPGTPPDSLDGHASGGHVVECALLHDSLQYGRSIGKTVFIYVTHDFKLACNDWSLVQQMDVWIYGHVHNAWQSTSAGSTLVQEQQHYPARILIGNGGFDNGIIDVVSFGRLREELLPGAGADGEDRVRLHFDIYDTCVSAKGRCPTTSVVPADYSCWKKCDDFPGGHDSGGGPRKATPTKHDLGFVLEAPRRPQAKPAPPPEAPFGKGAWKLQLNDTSSYFGLQQCGTKAPKIYHSMCLVVVDSEDNATPFSFYDPAIEGAATEGHKYVSAHLAVAADGRGPLQAHGDILYETFGFYDRGVTGDGSMRPRDALRFLFRQDADQWVLDNIAWDGSRFRVKKGSFLKVSFHVSQPETALVI